MSNKIEKIVEEKVRPAIEQMGVELVDVEYRKRDNVVNVTILICKEGGTDLDACESVHRVVDTLLDEIDINGSEPYILNVSSEGLDRAFKYERDYLRHIGEDVEIKFFANFQGNKKIEAKLLEYLGEEIKVLYEGKEVILKISQIAKINCAIRFS